MPSTRRTFIAAAAVTGLSGCSGLDVLGGGDRGPRPEPFLTEASDWARPDYDVANSNAPPAHAAPDTLGTSSDWNRRFEASSIDDVAGPVVADGIAYLVYVGLDGGEEFERLVAVDARTGDERWQFEVTGSAHAYPPTVAGETVYWLASARTVHALNPADGSVRWTYDGLNHKRPVVTGGVVLAVGGTHRKPVLEALDPNTGSPYWHRSEGERTWQPLAANDEVLFARLDSGSDDEPAELHALDPYTGETLWANSAISSRTVTVGPSHVLASTGPTDRQTLLALNLRTRDIDWSETVSLERTVGETEINGQQSVGAVTGNHVLVRHRFHGYTHDRIECRHLNSGSVRWTVAGEGDTAKSLSSPVVAGDGVYVTEYDDPDDGTRSSALRVLDLRDGTDRQRVPTSAWTVWRPVVADGRLFVSAWTRRGHVSLSAR